MRVMAYELRSVLVPRKTPSETQNSGMESFGIGLRRRKPATHRGLAAAGLARKVSRNVSMSPLRTATMTRCTAGSRLR
jgi:hypothetical protein